jgi:DNA helicase-2/ATP-dependent DNA helicase PcrA
MHSVMSDLLDQLNPEQQAAVLHKQGPALVLAGAGSGKTRVLTTRAAHLLESQQVQPHQILLVTFTNKAAHEMNQRLLKMSGTKLPMSGTFHSLCARILRQYGHHVGLDKNYIIYDTDDQQALIKQIYKEKGFSTKEFKPKAVKAVISNAKNEMLGVEEYQRLASGKFQEFVARIYKIYQHQLLQNKAVDFDDLLLLVNQLFEQNKEILAHYQDQVKHVLVDEYQDTNKAQYLLTKYFAKPDNNLFVVGDFSQSIYAWRGADYRNMFLLQKDFDELTEYKLERNYRSTQNILDAATQVISHNTSHPVLKLWTEQSALDPVEVLETQDQNDEATQVIQKIKQLSSQFDYSDMAILYRTNAQSRPFEEACLKYGIPYQLVGGFKFYERKEVKDVLAYLKLMINPQDTVAQERVLKIGKRRYAKFDQLRTEIREQIPEMKPLALLEKILQATTYQERYDENDPDDLSRLENIQELLNVSSQFNSTAQFLENISLIQDQEMGDVSLQKAENKLTMMSLHSAKGLEFPIVFLVGMEEGLLPHSRSLLDKQQLEEERRLCYVGITRAKNNLFLSYARSRYMYGSPTSASSSRFLADIDPDILLINRSSYLSTTEGSNYGRFGKKNNSPKKPSGRRIVVEDEMLDDLLNDDMDIDAFLDS